MRTCPVCKHGRAVMGETTTGRQLCLSCQRSYRRALAAGADMLIWAAKRARQELRAELRRRAFQ